MVIIQERTQIIQVNLHRGHQEVGMVTEVLDSNSRAGMDNRGDTLRRSTQVHNLQANQE